MRITSGIGADASELRKLMAEHPDYPICVLAGENANCGDYGWEYCSDISFGLGEILDCDQPVNEDIVFSDRDDFNDRLEEWLWDVLNQPDIKEEQFQKALKEEKAKYEPYWKKCIFIYADN